MHNKLQYSLVSVMQTSFWLGRATPFHCRVILLQIAVQARLWSWWPIRSLHSSIVYSGQHFCARLLTAEWRGPCPGPIASAGGEVEDRAIKSSSCRVLSVNVVITAQAMIGVLMHMQLEFSSPEFVDPLQKVGCYGTQWLANVAFNKSTSANRSVSTPIRSAHDDQ